MTVDVAHHARDFTLDGYRALVASAASHYRFEPFGTTSAAQHVLWRHDVDMSVHRALRLAEIENTVGVQATYFLFLHSPFYNLLEPEIVELVQRIAELGHWLGLHFDAGFVRPAGLEASIEREARVLTDVLEQPINAFSFHNPSEAELDLGSGRVGGLVNAYAASLRERYDYVSDSNGYWRFARLPDVVRAHSSPRLHVLTHPEWWQDVPMSPRDRVARCVQGRALGTLRDYDETLARLGRRNVR